MPSLVVVGAGGLGRETLHLARTLQISGGPFDPIGFVDDAPSLQGQSVLGLPVLGDVAWLAARPDLWYVVAVGSSRVRRRLVDRASLPPERAATLVHPSVEIPPRVVLGPGCLVFRGVAFMLNTRLGPHTSVDVNATIGHDGVLEAFVTVHPGCHVSGEVVLEEAVELGAGAVVLPGRRIGKETIVGAGAVVVHDIPAGCTAVGVPARPLAG